MVDLTKELGTAQKEANKFHTAETRTHDALHTALAGAYKFYVAGNNAPATLNALLLSKGLSPANLLPKSNQIIKLIFYHDPKAQSEKRQVISKWAIVLRELEEEKVKPGDAKAHIEKHTIDGLVQVHRNRPSSSVAAGTKTPLNKFDQGKRIAASLESLGEFATDGTFPDGLGLALIEFNGTQAIIKHVVANESDAATEKFTRGLVQQFPPNAEGFLPLGLLSRMATNLLVDKLSAVISNTAEGCTARIALDGNLKTVLARGFFPRIPNLPIGDYHLDDEALKRLGRLLPKHRADTWTVSSAAKGSARIIAEIMSGSKIVINLTKYAPSTKLASLSSSAKGVLSIPTSDGKFLQDLSDKEGVISKSLTKTKKKTLTHTISTTSWTMGGSAGNKMRLPLPQNLPSGTGPVTIELKKDTLKRISKASKAVTSIYKKSQPSLMIGNGYLALTVVDAHAGQWELIVPQQKGGSYDDALMTDDAVDQVQLV